jgi:hypothetical protein
MLTRLSTARSRLCSLLVSCRMTCISPIYGYSNFRSGDLTTLVTLLRFVDHHKHRFWIWSPHCTQLSLLNFTPLAQHSVILLVLSPPPAFHYTPAFNSNPVPSLTTTMILLAHSIPLAICTFLLLFALVSPIKNYT